MTANRIAFSERQAASLVHFIAAFIGGLRRRLQRSDRRRAGLSKCSQPSSTRVSSNSVELLCSALKFEP